MKKFIRILLTVLSIIIFLLLIILLVLGYHKSKDKIPYIFGFTGFVNTGTSMVPTILKDDLIIVKKEKSYEVGDIICFNNDGVITTHRIINIKDGFYETGGDNNIFLDQSKITDLNVYGKMVIRVPYVGKIINFINNHKWVITIGLVFLLVSFIGINIGLKYVR